MPNIFICGYGERADAMKDTIDRLMREMNLQDDAITSTVDMKAESCDGKKTPRPYLRICSTDGVQIFKIISALKRRKVREEIEWLVMSGFISSADKM